MRASAEATSHILWVTEGNGQVQNSFSRDLFFFFFFVECALCWWLQPEAHICTLERRLVTYFWSTESGPTVSAPLRTDSTLFCGRTSRVWIHCIPKTFCLRTHYEENIWNSVFKRIKPTFHVVHLIFLKKKWK